MREAPGPRRLAVGLVVTLVAAGCGGFGSSRDAAESPKPDPFESIQARPPSAEKKAAPRWEALTVLSGSGPVTTAPFTVVEGALQWKARWHCESGSLRLTVFPPPRRPGPLIDGPCPGEGEERSVQKGALTLVVDASGPWRVTIEQQVETPLDEPPMAEMTAPGARSLARGTFYDIERRASGTAILHRLADGRLALRLEGFETPANTDLFVWISEAPRPATSQEVVSEPYVDAGPLKSTLGNQNYLLPGLSADRVRSIVIWCVPVHIAYGAAPLQG